MYFDRHLYYIFFITLQKYFFALYKIISRKMLLLTTVRARIIFLCKCNAILQNLFTEVGVTRNTEKLKSTPAKFRQSFHT